MAAKNFKIPREQLKPLVRGKGLCIAPDTVLVDGMPVSIVYRVMPSWHYDSGWRFFSGTESDDYLSDSRFNGVYDLNTVVNYCPETLKLLDSPPYTAYRRDENGDWINISYDVDWRYWS
ncbi:MAG: DUF2185 domain-containing protein [Clostridia bacterium]|jgi:hypothetical protein|nr:DUF2185 domain-containing protein [Clostridia bacterium]